MVSVSITDCALFDVDKNVDIGRKGRPEGHYITAGQCTLSPPQQKGASFAPAYKM